MNNRKILFLSPLPPPSYGSAMSSEMCLEILKKSGKFKVKNIKINFAKNMDDVGVLSTSKIFFVFDTMKKIKKEINEFNPDLVYFMPATSKIGLIKDFLLSSVVKKSGRKMIYHVRTKISENDKKSFLKKIIYRRMFFNEKIIVLDDLLKDDVKKYLNPSETITLPNAIKNTVSESYLKKIIKNRESNGKFEFLFLSNMYESKGWLLLLKACVFMKKKSSNFVCNFIGGWPSDDEKNKFFDFVKDNDLKNYVKYWGPISGTKRDAVYEKADAFVFPTYYELEAHPRVIIEAMMHGLPVIANNHASIPSTIQDGKTGFLLKENSPKEIYDYLLLLEKNKYLRNKIGMSGRKRFLEKYEIEKYKRNFIDVIRKS